MALDLSVSSAEPGRARPEPLRAVDWLLLAYVAVASVVAVQRAPGKPECWWLLLGHALFVILLILLTRSRLGRVGRMVRELYPLFLLPALYSELDVLNLGVVRPHDALVQRWELLVFGSQISREWWQAVPSRFLSTVLHAAYLSYYLIIAAPALYFAWKGDLAAVHRFVLVVMATFIFCYLVFLFFPVSGPYYQFPHPAGWFIENLPARLAYDALATGSSYGAAFPSSHVAAATAATLAAGRTSRRLGLILLIPTFLLTVAVVYCQMHYGVDALAGLAVGVAISWLLRGRKSVSGKQKT